MIFRRREGVFAIITSSVIYDEIKDEIMGKFDRNGYGNIRTGYQIYLSTK